MRGRGVTRVFTFDRQFRTQGFASIPATKR